LICVVGPTAIGKTALGIKIAEKFGAEILSADSRQIYRHMAIGTAAPTKEEQQAAPHHFVNFLEPSTTYSAGDFEKDSLTFLSTYFRSHSVAVLVGGSGLYVKGLIDGFDSLPFDPTIRATLNERLLTSGLPPLAAQLLQLDPTHHAIIDPHNPQRVVRALEVCLTSGKPFSSFHTNTTSSRPFDIIQIGLCAPRDIINKRIQSRTHTMLASGWLEETQSLLKYKEADPQCNSLKTVGYRELMAHLEGDMTLEAAVERIIISTRQFAKRQMTWFKKDTRIVWFDFDETDKAIEFVREFVNS